MATKKLVKGCECLTGLSIDIMLRKGLNDGDSIKIRNIVL